MFRNTLFIVLSWGFITTGCSSSSDSSPNGGGGGNGPLGSACSLDGTWVRCTAQNGGSLKIEFIAAGTQLREVVSTFTTADCTGSASLNYTLYATATLGPIGGSTSVAGATDATVSSDTDIFGCGANKPAYTIFKFNTDCNQFQPAGSAPSCDPSGRPTALDPAPFTKQ